MVQWLGRKIPPKLGQCKNLKDLILNNNHLSGGIPIELFNCSNLEWISLINNELAGEIPLEFDLLTREHSGFMSNVGNSSCKGVRGLLEFSVIRPERLLQYSPFTKAPGKERDFFENIM
ncbi:hypothetical protein RJT34_33095 [Clitoria ternatea]|uniref:non-specific serine/threonine protein kinase n=1 Tax=Clitoria ternatea TaxID=43366 RepID=A0AAN9EZ97_CLITE